MRLASAEILLRVEESDANRRTRSSPDAGETPSLPRRALSDVEVSEQFAAADDVAAHEREPAAHRVGIRVDFGNPPEKARRESKWPRRRDYVGRKGDVGDGPLGR